MLVGNELEQKRLFICTLTLLHWL